MDPSVRSRQSHGKFIYDQLDRILIGIEGFHGEPWIDPWISWLMKWYSFNPQVRRGGEECFKVGVYQQKRPLSGKREHLQSVTVKQRITYFRQIYTPTLLLIHCQGWSSRISSIVFICKRTKRASKKSTKKQQQKKSRFLKSHCDLLFVIIRCTNRTWWCIKPNILIKII